MQQRCNLRCRRLLVHARQDRGPCRHGGRSHGRGSARLRTVDRLPTGRYATVATGDVNNDGKADIVTANGGDSTVSVLLGRDDGSFQAKDDTNWSCACSSVGEFNGDGKQDVATRNTDGHGLGSVACCWATATALQGKVDYPTGGSGTDVAVGDFNGDGKQDLAATSSQREQGRCEAGLRRRQLQGQGRLVGTVRVTLVVGDFNGDGKHALVVANGQEHWTRACCSVTGAGSFAGKIDFTTGDGPTESPWVTSTATASRTW